MNSCGAMDNEYTQGAGTTVGHVFVDEISDGRSKPSTTGSLAQSTLKPIWIKREAHSIFDALSAHSRRVTGTGTEPAAEDTVLWGCETSPEWGEQEHSYINTQVKRNPCKNIS